MNYQQYLFACLLKEVSSTFAALPYDEQYEAAIEQYKYFEASKYNNPSTGLYECLTKYINAHLIAN